MLNSILISKVIYELLSKSEILKSYIDTKIYPLVAENGTKSPYIVYYRDDIISLSSKDGLYEDEVTFTIITVSDKYLESLEIANEIRTIFDGNIICKNSMEIRYLTMTGIEETYENNSYVQRLHFKCTIMEF